MACGVKIKPWMNEMVVKVIGSDLPLPEESYLSNPGGFGPNGSGNSAYNKI